MVVKKDIKIFFVFERCDVNGEHNRRQTDLFYALRNYSF